MKKFLFLLLMTFISHTAVAKEIPLFVYFSESHRCLFEDWFEPSLPDEFDLQVYQIEQLCLTGNHMEDGWKQAMRKKVELTLDMIDRYWGEIFIYSDVDIQFFRPFSEEILFLMEYHDLLIQRSGPLGKSCAGFFVARANKETRKLFKKTLLIMDDSSIKEDEAALNLALESSTSLKWTQLPITYYNGGLLTGLIWEPGMNIPVPKNIVLHHANWTKGVVNKIRQFECVRSEVEKTNQNTSFFDFIKNKL